MDIAREKRLNMLLLSALERPPGERREFLRQASADDYELIAEAEAMLEEEGELGEFLERPAAAPKPVPPTTVMRGLGGRRSVHPRAREDSAIRRSLERIGPYRLLEVLGEGGMGRVYLARQVEPVRRKVALKLVPADLSHPEAMARFKAERQAMARLTHPNIGQILEAGTTDDGHPYFAMEWVDGPPITTHCDERSLSVEKRLGLFVEVCRGVQHAHQKGIIHRDLKPSNILVAEVDGRAIPKIIDFGIAKALEDTLTDTLLTTDGQLVGTPAYMSPEALGYREDDGDDKGGESKKGDLDTRSDVYSLGILLYEMLTGVRPFESRDEGLPMVFRRILEEEAPPPSARFETLAGKTRFELARLRQAPIPTLRRQLTGDLDQIVLKAIAKNRRERYGSAAELAEDVERHLRHEPVSAVTPTVLYKAKKFIRRNRLMVAAALAIVAILLLGLITASLMTWRAVRAENTARAEAARANREAAAAQRSRDEAEEVVEFLVGLFRESNPMRASGTPRSPEAITARELIDRGAEQIGEDLAARPLARARLSETIGKVYQELGDFDAAEPLLEEALELRRGELGDDHPEVAQSHLELGRLSTSRNHLEEASFHLEWAFEIESRALERQGETGSRTLVAILTERGQLERLRGQYDSAETHLRRALEISQSLPVTDPISISVIYNSLANLEFHRDRDAEAETLYRLVLEIQRQMLPPGHPRIIQTVNNLAISLAKQGRLEAAAPLFEEALELRRALFGDEHPAVAESLNNLGVLYLDLDRPRDAEPLHRQALEMRQSLFGPRHRLVAWSLDNLGVTHHRLEHTAESERFHRRALETRLALFGEEHPEVARSYHHLAQAAEASSRLDEAVTLYERSLAIRQQLDAGHPSAGRTTQRLGALLWRRGDRQRGEELLQRAIDILEARLPAEDPDVLEARRLYEKLTGKPAGLRDSSSALG